MNFAPPRARDFAFLSKHSEVASTCPSHSCEENRITSKSCKLEHTKKIRRLKSKNGWHRDCWDRRRLLRVPQPAERCEWSSAVDFGCLFWFRNSHFLLHLYDTFYTLVENQNRQLWSKSMRPTSISRGYIIPTSIRIRRRRKTLRWSSIGWKRLIRCCRVRRIDKFMTCWARRDWRPKVGRWYPGELVVHTSVMMNWELH